MGRRSALLLLLLVVCYALVATVGAYEDEGRGRREREEEEGGEEEGGSGRGRRGRSDWFILQDSRHVVKTEAGEMKVTRGVGGRFVNSPMHIGFITMEPNSLFIPQYLDSSLIIFIRRGEARIGSINKDDLVEQQLKAGDIYRIQAGSAFYLVNTAKEQRVHIICSIDTSESLNWHAFQSFFIGGGTNPTSVLAGFDHQTLATAFNVSHEEISEILNRQQSGAIVYLSSDSHQPSVWNRFLEQEQHERASHLKRIMHFEEEEANPNREEDDQQQTWSWRKLLISVLGKDENRDDRSGKRGRSSDSYNLYDRRPDFRNNYGWSRAVDGSDYSPLKSSGIGIYLVNLTAGSMMAPHINPTATEYGIVLRGTGHIQIVYPNGTMAMNAEVSEGNVFWVPRYFPFCQIASQSGSFEFFGFTTSAHKNRPQFLVGSNSLLRSMRGPEFAAAFGVSEKRLRKIINAQHEGVILPSPSAAPGDEKMPSEDNEPDIDKLESTMKMKNYDMVMGFD